MMPTDAILRATQDLCNVLKGKRTLKGETRTAIGMLIDIFRVYKCKPTNIDHQREEMRKAAENKKRSKTEELEAQDIHSVPNEAELGSTDLQSPPLPVVSHPTIPNDPHLIKNGSLSNFQRTRKPRREKLLAAVEILNNCPMAHQASRRKYPLAFLCDFTGSVLDTETGEFLEYRHLIEHPKFKDDWGYSFGNEVGRLAQGMPGRNDGTNTIFFIDKSQILADKWKYVTHSRIVCNVRPQKAETNKTRLTFGSNNLSVDMDCGTPTADFLTVKYLLNSVISTPGVKFMTRDIKDFYLNTPMDKPEFLRMKDAHFPQDVIDHYHLNEKVDSKGMVYVRVEKCMYGLPQAGLIAQQLLEGQLSNHGYR